MKLDIDSDGYHRCLQFLILDLGWCVWPDRLEKDYVCVADGRL